MNIVRSHISAHAAASRFAEVRACRINAVNSSKNALQAMLAAKNVKVHRCFLGFSPQIRYGFCIQTQGGFL